MAQSERFQQLLHRWNALRNRFPTVGCGKTEENLATIDREGDLRNRQGGYKRDSRQETRFARPSAI